MNNQIEVATPQEIDSIISKYDQVRNDVVVKATSFAIPVGQKFTIQYIRGKELSLHTYENEEVSENQYKWFQNIKNHLITQILNLDPILLEIPVERPVLVMHCVWDESNKRAYFYLVSISTSLYDTVYLKGKSPSPLGDRMLNLLDLSNYASIRVGKVFSTLSENGQVYLKKQLESSSKSFLLKDLLHSQSVLWKLDFINCDDVDTYFIEYK